MRNLHLFILREFQTNKGCEMFCKANTGHVKFAYMNKKAKQVMYLKCAICKKHFSENKGTIYCNRSVTCRKTNCGACAREKNSNVVERSNLTLRQHNHKIERKSQGFKKTGIYDESQPFVHKLLQPMSATFKSNTI